MRLARRHPISNRKDEAMKHFTILSREKLLARSYGEAPQKEVREPATGAPVKTTETRPASS